jgi:TATA-binding protein-associated factor
VKRLSAQHKLVLTGTLIQNRIHELWATFDFLMPFFLGSSKAFIKNYANPISRSQLPTASASEIAFGVEKLRLLHQQVLPFILRREKSQVLPELPQMSQTVIRVPMSSIQQHIYREFCAEKNSLFSIEEMEKSLVDDSNRDSGISADLLKSLLFLRLLCTHPSLVLTKQQLTKCPSTYLHATASGKMLALSELLREAIPYEDSMNGADNDFSLLYCDHETDEQDAYFSVLDTPDPFLGDFVSACTASEKAATKLPSKCLIFAQFTKSLDAVEEFVFKSQMPSLRYVRLDGTVSPEKRMDIVRVFERDSSVKVLLLTTRVGGIGLNLTSASTVIFLEMDFNPYADFQAQDRCMRIGQTRQVDVYRIVTQESIEEKIFALQKKKIQVADAVVNSDNSSLYSMGTDRLLDVVTVRSQTDAANDFDVKLEYDLEGIVEQCTDDYKNLSVDEFLRNFKNIA